MNYILLLLMLPIFTFDDSFKVQLSGFDNDKGKVMIRVRDENGKILFEKTAPIKGKRSEISLPLSKTQKVGIEAFHDENNNDKMDKNFLGMPTEKWGVSSNNRPTLRAPELKEILVPVKSNSVIKIKLD